VLMCRLPECVLAHKHTHIQRLIHTTYMVCMQASFTKAAIFFRPFRVNEA